MEFQLRVYSIYSNKLVLDCLFFFINTIIALDNLGLSIDARLNKNPFNLIITDLVSGKLNTYVLTNEYPNLSQMA